LPSTPTKILIRERERKKEREPMHSKKFERIKMRGLK
jgi:hypothetical protein